jgi:hypothetical protein
MKRAIAVLAALAAVFSARPARAGTFTFTDRAGDTALVSTQAVTSGPSTPLATIPGPHDPSVDIVGVRVGTTVGTFNVAVQLANVLARPPVGSRTVSFEVSGDERLDTTHKTVAMPIGPPIEYEGYVQYWLWTMHLRAEVARNGGAMYSMEIVANETPGTPGDTVSRTVAIAGSIDAATNEVRFAVPFATVNAVIDSTLAAQATTFAPGMELQALSATAEWKLPAASGGVVGQLVDVGVDYATGPDILILP